MTGVPLPVLMAILTIPYWPFSEMGPRSISTAPAYVRMLRATSEIAVAINVASVGEKPISPASSRPRWRARTRSASDSMAMRVSVDAAIGLPSPDEQRQALFQVERRAHPFQAEA